MSAKDVVKSLLAEFHDLLESCSKTDRARRLQKKGKLKIGAGSYGLPIVHELDGDGPTRVLIGKFCSIGDGVHILVGGEHQPGWVSTYPFRLMYGLEPKFDGQPFSRGDVVIGNDVWIGNDVFIRSGVTVGDGAVIGAGSLVTRNVAPFEIVAGNPSRRIRLRFDEKQVEALLQIKWWDWPAEKIIANVELLSSHRVTDFIERFG